MAGKRQHTVPQFLLRGFESSQNGDGEALVWFYRKGQPGIETAVKGILLECYFYGKPEESDLDARITSLEASYSALTAQLRLYEGLIPANWKDPVAELVSHLCVRTRAVRESVSLALEAQFDGLLERLSRPETIKAAVDHVLRKRGRTGNLAQARSELLPAITAIYIAKLDELRSGMILPRTKRREAFRAGHIDTLSRNLDCLARRRTYEGYTWAVVHTEHELLLGDSVCIFETSGKRRFKPLDDKGDRVRRIYLPLSAHRLLIGGETVPATKVEIELIRQAASFCSWECVVSASPIQQDSALLRGMGQWGEVFDDSERESLITNMTRDFVRSLG